MDPKEETFKEVENLVYSTVHKFLRKHQTLELDEAISSAHLSFMQAYNDYDPEKGTMFTTWVAYKIIYGLLLDFKSMVKFRKFHTTNVQNEIPKNDEEHTNAIDGASPSDYGDNLSSILEELELHPDASYVASIAICPPKAITKILNSFGLDNGSNRKIAIRLYLKSKGWNDTRIKTAFEIIKRTI